MPTWSVEQLRAFLGHVADDHHAGLWRLAATTGLRRGELAGLRWRDVDLDAGPITVVQQRAKGAGTVAAGPTKTRRSRRLVSIDARTVEALREHRKAQLGDPAEDRARLPGSRTGLLPGRRTPTASRSADPDVP